MSERTGDVVLSVKDLHVSFYTNRRCNRVLRGVSFDIRRGRTLCIVGESGCGKSVTANAILRLLPELSRIEQGSVTYWREGEKGIRLDQLKKNGREMRALRGKDIAIIFQDPMTALNPALTVGDQVLESLEIHNLDKRSKEELDARVDELFKLVGIPPERKKEYPHQFSGGMKQRIVIAIALACQPQLLIADEPTTALDVTIQAQILKLMENLKNELGTSMIMITHDLGVVAETCDKVAVMYAGEIVEYGTARDIFDPGDHHPYTVGLFNAIPNLDEKTDRLHPIDGLMPDPTNLPAGCKFSPRCPYCTEECVNGTPYTYEEDGHRIFCNRFRKEG